MRVLCVNKISSIRFLLFEIIFALILALPIHATAEDYKQSIDNFLQQKGYKAIPITIKNGFLVIDASINNNPSIAIIDTGSSDINITK